MRLVAFAGRRRWVVVRLAGALALAALPRVAAGQDAGDAARPSPGPFGRIEGIVFDSLRMQPVGRAAVWSQSAARSTIADERGRFLLDSLPLGEQLILAADPLLDSLGIQLAQVVMATQGPTTGVTLATPSIATLAARMCGGDADTAATQPRGMLFGTVRDAASGSRIAGARVEVSWLRVGRDSTRLQADIAERVPQTDSTGAYATCSVPVDTALQVTAFAGDAMTSGTVYLEVGPTRIARRDLVVASTQSPATGAARGAVVDTAGRGLASVSVSVDGSAVEARTARDGSFFLGDAPLGTRTLVVRRPGFAPVYASVSFTAADTPFVHLEMSTARLLSAVEVRAERVSRTMAAVDRRRRVGFGYHRTAASLRGIPSYEALFRSFPSLQVVPGRIAGDFSLLAPGRSFSGAACRLTIFIDGLRSSSDMLNMYPIADLVAVEVYPRGAQVPAEYQMYTNGCGAALLWTNELG